MKTVLVLFFLIFSTSALVAGILLLVRRRYGMHLKDQEYLHTSLFSFFTTFYAFFIGFAIVTLWSTFLTAQDNVNREADGLIVAYYASKSLPNSDDFRQVLRNYTKTVLEDEWPAMSNDSMSPAAAKRFDEVLAKYTTLTGDSDKLRAIFNSLAEAGRQRLFRSTTVKGNLYPTVWIILFFGFGALVFGLFLLNRQLTAASWVFEFMVIFIILTCLLFVYDINTPFSGFITVQPDAFKLIYNKMASLP